MVRIALIGFLLSFAPSVFADELRLYGTNVIVDFSLAKAAGPYSSYSNYWLVGGYLGRAGNTTIVAEEQGKLKFPAAHFLRRNERAYPRVEREEFTVLRYQHAEHLPDNPYEIDNIARREPVKIRVEAIGLRRGKITTPGQPARKGFDCGQVFTNEVTTNHTVLLAVPKGLVKIDNWKPSRP